MKQRDEKLALYGGTPVRNTMISYGSQWIAQEDINAVVDTLQSPFLTQGPRIEAFEREVALRCKANYAVAFSNGTAALHGAMFAAGIKEGDEVITTPLTFVATSNSVLYQRGTPVFVDIDPDTYLMDIDKTAAAITSRTKAIAPVDFGGQPVDMGAYRKLADKHGLIYIQDAAHSFGASYAGMPVGSLADMTMLSFHPVKPVTTAEGGIIVTNSEEYYERLLRFRSHGITRDEKYLSGESEGPWYYEMLDLGYNYRMTDIQAALGLSQLERLSGFLERRKDIAALYTEAFSAYEKEGLLKLPTIKPSAYSGWHLYILSFNLDRFQCDRAELFNALRAENIGVNVHYIPVNWQPYYRQLGYRRGICPIAEAAYQTFITIPLFPKMSDADFTDVIRAVYKVIQHYMK